MLSQRSRTALRFVSGLSSSFQPGQYNLHVARLTNLIHVRQSSAVAIRAHAYPQISPRVPFRGLSRNTVSSLRYLSITPHTGQKEVEQNKGLKQGTSPDATDDHVQDYRKTEKAEAAKVVDLSARLKDRSSKSERGEIIRLLKLAGREWRAISGMFPQFI